MCMCVCAREYECRDQWVDSMTVDALFSALLQFADVQSQVHSNTHVSPSTASSSFYPPVASTIPDRSAEGMALYRG